MLVPPSPKVQLHVVGELVEVSANWTVRGAVPDTGVALNPATGTCGCVVVAVVVTAVVTVAALTVI